MSKSILRVALYCRVATAEQLGAEHQEDYLIAYAKEHDYFDPVSYVDNGYSGLNLDRPAFSRLNYDIQTGKVDTLIVRNISRIGRNMFEIENWIAGIEKKGVKFITTDHPYNTEFTRNLRNEIHATYLRSKRGAMSTKKRKGKA